MRITIDRDHLRDGLKTVAGAVATRSTLPVLGMVLLSADDRGLRFSSTNLEMAATTLCADCQVQENGAVAVPFKDLLDLAAKLPAGAVDLSTTDPTETEADPEHEPQAGQVHMLRAPDTLYITAPDVEGKLHGLPATEFPAISFEPADPTVVASWDALDFARDVEAVAFAASTEGTRPVLHGIFFQIADDGCRMVSADGFRLAVLGAPLKPFQRTFSPPQIFAAQQGSSPAPTTPAPPDPWTQAILPAVCLAAFTRGLRDGLVTMSRGDGENWIFRNGDSALLVREIEGDFPDYTQILPATPPALTVTVSRAALARFLDLSLLYARHSALLVRVEVRENSLSLLGNAEIGNSDSDVPVTTHVAGGDIEFPFLFGINGRYLAEAVRAAASMNADGDEVEIRLWHPDRPVVVAPRSPAGPAPLTIVQMPMHITR